MKIAVIGGSGRVGTHLVAELRRYGCSVVPVSRAQGVDIVTGEGLGAALAEAGVVIDVSNVRSLDGAGAPDFFETAGRNLVTAARQAGVRCHIVLSIVGVERLLASDYFRAKQRQEDMVRASGTPFTIVRATQFFDFIADVVQRGTAAEIPIAPALVQPIAARDVADALVDILFDRPSADCIEIAGPERLRLDTIATEIATAHEDGRRIVADPGARYFGARITERTLLPETGARIGALRFDDWLRDSLIPVSPAAASPWP